MEIQKIRENQKNSLASLDGTKDDNNYDPLQGLAKSEEDDGDKDDDEEEEDEEQKKDSDFIDDLSRVINLSDISQEFKDDDMNKIGQIESLGKGFKKHLKNLNYAEIDPGDAIPAAQTNKFIEM